MNSVVRAMSIMYVRCESVLGHMCTSLTCGYPSRDTARRATPQVTVMGVRVPLGHMLTYMMAARARGRTCPVLLHLTDSHGLISIYQEHEIPARGTVTGDHELGNALTWAAGRRTS